MNSVFVWTHSDVFGLIIFGLIVAMYVAVAIIDKVRERRAKK